MRNKRPRSNKDQETDVYMPVQPDDIHSNSYSRPRSSFNTTDAYRVPSSSSRSSYVRDRDASPPRGRHSEDWRHPDMDHDRYPYDSGFVRSERNEYDDGGTRGAASWVADPYAPPRSTAWGRYDNGAPSNAYHHENSWAVPSSSSYDNRASYHESWAPPASRDMPVDDWSESGRAERHSDHRQADWRGEGRKEKVSSSKFQSDSGWDSRRRDRVDWVGDPMQDDSRSEKSHITAEDRAWEPAASWKSTSTSEYQRHPSGQKPSQSKTKRNSQNKQRREWRDDDGDLNNWKRRDVGPSSANSANPHSGKRKHIRSLSRSRSRSRSPATSYRSHISSRGRSRSRSFSPASKRRRRDSDATDVNGSRAHVKREKITSRSPSPSRGESLINARQSSPSVTSSISDRSLSKSPVPAIRSVHRLPSQTRTTGNGPEKYSAVPTNGPINTLPKNGKTRNRRKVKEPLFVPNGGLPVDDPYVAASQPSRRPVVLTPNRHSNHEPPIIYERPPPHDSEEYASGRGLSAPSHYEATQPLFSHQRMDHSGRSVTIAMPPPTSIPPAYVPRTAYSRPVIPDAKLDTPTHPIPFKGMAFKPIAKPSSSLKKFFPGDEDDMDVGLDKTTKTVGQTRPGGHISVPPPSHDVRQPSAVWSDPHMIPDHRMQQHQLPHDLAIQPLAGQQRTSPLDMPGHTASSSQPHAGAPVAANQYPTLPPGGHSGRPSPHMTELSDNLKSVRSSHDMDNTTATPLDNHDTSNPHAIPTSTPSSSTKDLYKIVSQVGEGTFGKVYKARNIITKTFVALKRIRMESERDGFPVTAMREIKLLQSLRHESIVRLYEMMVSNGSVYMVFEYMDHDLTGVLSQTQFTFLPQHLKSLCHQMLAGLAYLHHKGVIHRDIKGSNILINNRGELKLADFGLARIYQKRRRADYTNRVITLWYRPPELLFGATVYGPEVDMWSAGCIMLELFTKRPVFQGTDEIHQVEVIFKLLGSPTSDQWVDVANLPWFELVRPQHEIPNRFREAFSKWMGPAALDLAEKLLTYDPSQRIDAVQAMATPYFSEDPPAAAPVGLCDVEGEWHELETKRERAKRKERKAS